MGKKRKEWLPPTLSFPQLCECVYLILVEIRLLHFSQGVFQVAEHKLLNLVVVRGPHLLDSQKTTDVLEHANEAEYTNKLDVQWTRERTFCDSRRKLLKSSREILMSGLSMNLVEKVMVHFSKCTHTPVTLQKDSLCVYVCMCLWGGRGVDLPL